jgi:enoyl-CoA hydratase/carnithine racemase
MNATVESTAPTVNVSIEEDLAIVELSNPKSGNALTRNMFEILRDTWASIEGNSAIRAVVFSAQGDRFFCTGADMSSLKTQGALRRPGEATGDQWMLTWRMASLSKPVVVAVNGVVAGGGLGFVTDGDVVVASRNAKFLDTHVAVGQICGYGALRLVGIIGASEATRVALAGGALSADRAHQLGLVNELCDTPQQAKEIARALATKIAAASPAAVRSTFHLLQAFASSDENRVNVAAADKALDAHMQHPDATEGPTAWLEKREPRWAP